MPPLPGEERTLTVFADIHYYFQSPSPRPLLHRFDKGSYLYIYHNPTRQSSRLEIANHPGTPEQDAFNGYLDGVRLVYSHKFPTLLTCIVDASDSQSPTSSQRSSSPGRDPEEWRLPSSDPRDQGKTRWRIHTLDCYFWMLDDAKLVIDTMKRLLHPSQLDIMDAPETETRHEDSMSPVVQNLEHVAISDPAYANGKTRNSQNLPSQAGAAAAAAAAASPGQQQAPSPDQPSVPSYVNRSGSVPSEGQHASFAPMAYNPAAPPAPEPIAHREKTPPPADAADGTGLAAAAVADHMAGGGASQLQTYTGVPQAQPYTGVPGPVPSTYGHYGSPPPSGPPAYFPAAPGTDSYGHNASVSSATSLHRASTTSSYAPDSAGAARPRSGHEIAAAVTAQAFAPPPQDPNAHLYGSGEATPLQSPGAQILGPGVYGQPHQPLQHVQPQYADYLSTKISPPPGGYAQYSYDQQPQRYDPGSQYDVHSQVYRPTEAEVNKPTKKPTKPSKVPYDGGYQTGKVEQGAEKVEKGINKYLKKLEKRIG